MYKKDWKKHNKGKTTIDKRDFVDLTRGIWKLNTECRGLTKANFPVDLPEKCIRLLSYEGDVILDPFMGSGTTAESCLRTNRKYIGFEISKKYCDIMKCRTTQQRLNNGDGIPPKPKVLGILPTII
jgi:site-specific DNA-methyltransferase (adenine-specific)